MNYPLISEYIEAIKAAEDNFDQLKHLRPVLDDDGLPVMTSGNFAVVFKMKDERDGKLYAVRCFHRDQEGRAESYRLIEEELKDVASPYLVSFRYMDKELFVDSSQTDETEFPVLLMDWVEGITLDKYLRENLDDKYALELLAYRFSQLAQWLIPQPFAHGDLKPDNILVCEDGTLVLVDYDGMYVPTMKGQKARELGSPDFRHPSRTVDDFDEHIDDFSLVSILLSLKAISLQPELFEQYGATDRLLFSTNDYRNLSESQVMDAIKAMMQDPELATLYSIFILSAQNNLSQVSFRLLNLIRPKEPEYENLSTEVTKEDLVNARVDKYGVKYSADKKRLLKADRQIKKYSILKGTMVICNNAFSLCTSLNSIKVPNGVVQIGKSAFSCCWGLKRLTISDSVTFIGEKAFRDCHNLISAAIPKSVKFIGYEAFAYCKNLSNVDLPNSISSIEKECFFECERLTSIVIPNNVKSIGDWAFYGCFRLKNIIVPNNVTHIGNRAFGDCWNLTSVMIPNSVTAIGDYAFSGCNTLKKIVIQNTVTGIGKYVFQGCTSVEQIIIPMGTRCYFENMLPEYKFKLVEQ